MKNNLHKVQSGSKETEEKTEQLEIKDNVGKLHAIDIIRDDLPFLNSVDELTILRHYTGNAFDEVPFENEPTYEKFREKTDKTDIIYEGKKNFGHTMKSRYSYDLEKEGYHISKRIKCDVYKIPGQYRHLKYGEMIVGVLKEKYPELSEFKLKSYGDKDLIFLDLGSGEAKDENKTVYLDTNIFFNEDLKTKDHIVTFFSKHNHRNSTKESLHFLGTEEGNNLINKFLEAIK